MHNLTNDLPEGLALVETANGRWFPAFAPLTETPRWVSLLGDTDIPPAITPFRNPGEGYSCRHETVEACLAWYEAAILPLGWRSLATQTEIYPERNAWYQEEIIGLIGDTPTLQSIGEEVIAFVEHERYGVCAAIGSSPDEAIEALYQGVAKCVSFHQHESTQRRAS